MAALVSFCSLFLTLIISTATAAKAGGFSVELIHRDSPKSPFYNTSEAYRFNPPSISKISFKSSIIANNNEFLMKISLGTPPSPILAVMDTGSDLVWTQCQPCSHCYMQDGPLFNPSSSSTYRTLSCSSRQCHIVEGTVCSSEMESICHYTVTYGDQSFTSGDLAVDTITIGSTTGRSVALPETTFGCGHNNEGSFKEEWFGIIGLGGGAMSLISQMRNSIGGKFSYCLVPHTKRSRSSGKINFGSNGAVSGAGVVSTPFVKKTPDTFYMLTLRAISVEDDKIIFTGSFFGKSEGNIVIDSGTSFTVLPFDFYSKLEALVSSKIHGQKADSPVEDLRLCYNIAKGNIRVPQMTVHFMGADVKLKPGNIFVQVRKHILCFAFIHSVNDFAIYGNLLQRNFLVGYDTHKHTVSFKPMDCTKA
ncbi:hypothetical protein SLE2022_128600 [Rubroshorea leprosula]